MYNSILALLFYCGIKSEDHQASIELIKKIFKIENKEVLIAKKERVNKQYYVDFEITLQEVSQSIKNAEKFNNKMNDFISKISNREIIQARENLKSFFGGES